MSQVLSAAWPAPTTRFTAAYQAIANALLANTTFIGLVKLANLNVWCDGKQQQLLTGVQTGNLPEVTLIQTHHLLHPWGSTSKEACATRNYGLVAITDTMQIDAINAIEDAVMGAMYYGNLERTALFGGVNYIKNVMITGGGDGSNGIQLPTLPDATRGVNRQGALINIQLELYWPRTSLPT